MYEILQNISGFATQASAGIVASFDTGSAVDLAIKGIGAYLLVVWVAFVVWVVRDITNRSENLVVQTLSILLIVLFTPVFGLPLYLLVRPRATLFERYYEEAGLSEAETFADLVCDQCGAGVSSEYRYCPHCRNELLVPCPHCSQLVGKNWEHCAYCGKDPRKSAKPDGEKKERGKKATKSSLKKEIEKTSVERTVKVRIEEIPEA